MTYASAGNPGLPVWVGIIVSFLVLVGIVFVMKVCRIQSSLLVLVGIVFVMKVCRVQSSLQGNVGILKMFRVQLGYPDFINFLKMYKIF